MIAPALGVYRSASKQSIRLTLSDLLNKGIQIPGKGINFSHCRITPATIFSYSIKLPEDKRLPIGHAVFAVDDINHSECERIETGRAIFYFEPEPRTSAKQRLAYFKAFSLDEERFFPFIEPHNVEYQTKKPYSRENRHTNPDVGQNDFDRICKNPYSSRRWKPGYI